MLTAFFLTTLSKVVICQLTKEVITLCPDAK